MRRIPVTAGAAGLALLLAACGGSTTSERAAAPEGLSASSTPSQQVVGVRLCVVNSSTVSVNTSIADSQTLAPGARACAESNTPISAELTESIGVNGTDIMQVLVKNPDFGVAWVQLDQPAFGQCLSTGLLGLGAKSPFKDDGVLRYQFVRTTKVGQQPPKVGFELTLFDPSSPSADGQPVQCS